jgi:hypothetical protein
MSDLPTREEAQVAVQIWNTTINGYSDYPLLAHIGYEKPALQLVRARADGDLLTREELVATADYEAGYGAAQDRHDLSLLQRITLAINAALGVGGDEELLIHNPIDSSHNPEAETPMDRLEYRKSLGLDKPLEVEPEHQHQWLPWLTLANGSSWTKCTKCEEEVQYDHE